METLTAGNYFLRYLFAAIATAVCLPGVEGIGVGWFSTVSALFVLAASVAVFCIVIYGTEKRDKTEEKKESV